MDTNKGSGGDLRVRQAGEEATLIRFDLAGVFVSPNVDVHYAGLTLYALERTNENPMRIVAYQALRPWEELETTWISTSTGALWEEPGCYSKGIDVAGEALDSVLIEQVLDDVTIDLTEAVHSWAQNPASNYGVILKGEGPVRVRYSFVSSEYASVVRRPILRIIYSVRSATSASAGDNQLLGSPDGYSLQGGVVQ